MRYRILIVDDDEDIQVVLRATLSDYEVATANNGLDALQMLPQVEPDLMIVDIMMPVMDGMTLAREVVDDPNYRDIPFIFLTGLTDREHMMKGYKLGADVYLTKPIDPERLVKNVALFLQPSNRAPRPKQQSIEEIQTKDKAREKKMEESGKFEMRVAEPEASESPTPVPESRPPRETRTEPKQKRIDDTKPVFQSHRASDTPIPRVLVVEADDKSNRLIEHALAENYELLRIDSVLDAVRGIARWEPDIMIVDLSTQNAYQLITLVRKSRNTVQTPIVALSPKNTPRDREYCRRLGVNAYMGKPFYPDKLADTMSEMSNLEGFQVLPKKLEHSVILKDLRQEQEADSQLDTRRKFASKIQDQNEFQRAPKD